MTESPAELLEKAAVRLEELTKHFQGYVDNWQDTPLPGRFDGPVDAWHYDHTESLGNRDALKWIETMSPVVAAPLVTLLRDVAKSWPRGKREEWMNDGAKAALAFAKQVLGEQ